MRQSGFDKFRLDPPPESLDRFEELEERHVLLVTGNLEIVSARTAASGSAHCFMRGLKGLAHALPGTARPWGILWMQRDRTFR